MADAETRLRELLQDIARDHEYGNDDIKLTPISTGGANYTSKLFVTTLSAPDKPDLQLFSKVATIGEKMRGMTAVSFFETEIIFFTQILPKYRELEEAYKIPAEERLVLPQYYGGSLEYMKESVVLEDLSAKGYQMLHRFECFDWEYASNCVSMLARFHALSIALEKKDPAAYAVMVDDFKFDYPADKDYLNRGLLNAVNATDEKYRARVERLLRDDLEKQTFIKFWEPAQRRLVLCHGDFRPNNILHKTNEDGNLSTIMVDYQIIKRGNPVGDLMFFLTCGSDEQFRAKHLNQFFDHYYQALDRALQRLNINVQDVYLEKDYREDVHQMLLSGLTLGVYSLPFITVEEEDAIKPEDCVDVESFDLALGRRFPERFNGLVRTYVELGFL